jgi:hypothetical protein
MFVKPCACGCGELIQEANRNGPLYYKFGHNRKGLWWYDGKPHTTQGKKRPDASIRMKLHNPAAKLEVKLHALHLRIKQRLPKPKLCEACNKKPPYDLANVSGKYLEDLSDWEWLCRRCHMRIDGRMNNLDKKKVMSIIGAQAPMP